MIRIDVVPTEKKGKYKVMVNFGSLGSFTYCCPETANEEAKKIAQQYSQVDIHLITITK